MVKTIASIKNPLIKNLLLLREKPRERKEQNLIIIEGTREINLASKAGYPIIQLIYCKELIPDSELDVLKTTTFASVDMVEVSTAIYNKIAYRKDHEGVIALLMRQTLMP